MKADESDLDQAVLKAIGDDIAQNFKVISFATTITFHRNPLTGDLLPFCEEELSFPGPEHLTAQNSLSLSRYPSPATESIKGDPNNLPFEPATAGLSLEREKYAIEVDNESPIKTAEEREMTKKSLLQPILSKCQQFLETNVRPNLKQIEIEIQKEIAECSSISDIFTPILTTSKPLESSKKDLPEKVPSQRVSIEEVRVETNEKEIDEVIEKQKSAVVTLNIKDAPSINNRLYSTKYAIVCDSDRELPPFSELIPSPAFTYPFELDTFQKQAILCLEDKQNVFVAAHTSAGKTVVAEYAIALSIRCNSTRCVYTSPIKALSNQKFRDFCMTFGNENVGILTGDVQVRPEAPCLIMTTEILLQMLYRGASMIRDIEWVIFDEVHYVNDLERGHVWEETFIMLPEHANLVLLSATVPNVSEFADWLGRTRNRPTHVVYTTKRPIPLEHFLYLGTDNKFINERFKFIDEKGAWHESEYRKALLKKKERDNYNHSIKKRVDDRKAYITVIRHLQKEEKLPVIIFAFSRKRCDEYASAISGPIDLTTTEEKSNIGHFIRKSLQRLKKVDRDLPQVKMITSILKNGLGIHHSGILPLLKEITEILFTEGYVRVLFATETFAMGINMPARTVLFDRLEKHDGKSLRYLESSEYIQMAGRAGRRGKDKSGFVYNLCKQTLPELSDLKKITTGSATPLKSQFRLTYSMILNNLRAREHIRIESIMEKSFGEHEQQKTVPAKTGDIRKLQEQINQIRIDPCDICSDVKAFCNLMLECRRLRHLIMPLIMKRMHETKSVLIGRMIILELEDHPLLFGVILNARRNDFDVLAIDADSLINSNNDITQVNVFVQKAPFQSIHSILVLCVDPPNLAVWREKDAKSWEKRPHTQVVLSNVNLLFTHRNIKNFAEILFIERINPIIELKIRDYDNALLIDEYHDKFLSLISHQCLWCPNFLPHYKKSMLKLTLEIELKNAKFLLTKQSLGYYPDYKCKVKVLKRLGYVTDDDEMCLKTKGRIGCLLSEHELVLTELLTDKTFEELDTAYIASLLSVLFFRQNLDEQPTLDETMQKISHRLRSIGECIDKLQMDYQNEDEQALISEQINEGLMNVVYQWAKGTPFVKIVELTEVQEGIIVRCIQRIDGLLKDLKSAASFMGNPELAEKMEAVTLAIRRDIVFAASLYIQEGEEEGESVPADGIPDDELADLMI